MTRKIGIGRGVRPGSDEHVEARLRARPDAVENAHGAVAYEVGDPSERLILMAAGQMFNEKDYYDRDGRDSDGLHASARALIETAKAVAARDDGHADDLLRIARWLRDPIRGAKIRTTSQVLMAIAAGEAGTRALRDPDGGSMVRRYVPLVAVRPDDSISMFAAYNHLYGDENRTTPAKGKERLWRSATLPSALKRGLADAVLGYGERGIVKYLGADKRPRFSDVLRACDLAKTARRGRFNEALAFYALSDGKLPTHRCARCGALYAENPGKCYSHGNRCGCEEFEAYDASKLMPRTASRAAFFAKQDFDSEAMDLARAAGIDWDGVASHFGEVAAGIEKRAKDERDPNVRARMIGRAQAIRDALWEFSMSRMGYMALVKNVRNLLASGLGDAAVDRLVARIKDPANVASSKLLPYRFWSAYRECGGRPLYGALRNAAAGRGGDGKDPARTPRASEVLDALVAALDSAIDSVRALPGLTAFGVDLSGSMENLVSEKSLVTRAEVSAILGASLHRRSERSATIGFGTDVIVVHLSKGDSVMTNMRKIYGTTVGHSTNAWKVPALLRKERMVVDRLVVVSDEQVYNETGGDQTLYGEWAKYKRDVAPDAWLHVIRVGGAEFSSVPDGQRRVCRIAGFSERILDFIAGAEFAQPAAEEPEAADPALEADGAAEELAAEPQEPEEAEAAAPAADGVPPLEWIRANY